jgi:primosomal replication protein N
LDEAAGNRVVLTGRIAEIGELRYTPAGTPIVEFLVSHASQQIEAGIARKVECELPAIVLGVAANKVAAAKAAVLKFEGFLASRSRGSRQTVLHVNNFEIIG